MAVTIWRQVRLRLLRADISMACLVYKTIKKSPVSQKYINNIVDSVLKKCQVGEVDFSVHLIGDKKMKRLNRQHRGQDKTTDVLSFAMEEGKDLGDIFISIPQIERQARQFGVSTKEEFTRILIHGILHLLGYDHKKSADAKKMFAMQELLLKKIYEN